MANRLTRFEDYRFVGVRSSMRVYDCDDAAQFAMVRQLVEAYDLVGGNLIQTFAPDSLAEAANRGFRPAA